MKWNWTLGISLSLNLLGILALCLGLYRFGGMKNLWAKINNRGIDKMYENRKQLFEELPSDSLSIVFLGNSITAGNEWSEMLSNPKALNRGIPGDHCDGVLERLNAITKLNPRKIFLEIGVNDLMYHPPAVVFEKYQRLVQTIQEKMPGAVLYLQSVLPVNPSVSPVAVRNEDIRLLNADIKKLAEARGLTFIDLHPALSDAAGLLDARYTADGVHINGAAYLKWVEALGPYLVVKG